MYQTDLYIIIVSYNGLQWIEKCLVSTNGYNVVVVDNNSSDRTVEFIISKFPKVKILKQKQNLGFGQANNIGISYAINKGAEKVFLLNQDAYIAGNSLKKLIATMDCNREFGILSPIHLNGKGTKLDENFSYYLNYSNNSYFFSDHVLNNSKKNIYQVPFINAAGWLISRECLNIVGGFDPIFFHYGEDDNYCQRLSYHGFKIGVVPETKLLHDRENRSETKMKYGGQKYMELLEKRFKLKFANINKSWDEEFENITRKRKYAYFKTLIKLNFKKAKFFRNEYLMLRRIKSEILKSREINKSPGLNYLVREDQ